MELEENEIYETLGVTPPGDGETAGEEPAAGPDGPAAEETMQESGPDGGAGAEAEEEGAGAQPGGDAEAEPGAQADGGTERARQDEVRAAVDAAVAQAVARERERSQAEWQEFFSRAGLRNNATGAAITSREEFEAWYSAYEAERLSRELKEGKLTLEALDAVVRRAMARSDIARAVVGREADNDARQAANNGPQAGHDAGRPTGGVTAAQPTQADIDRELAEIHRIDGSVQELADILKLETAPAFREAVARGHSFLDAFKLANFDRLQQQRQAQAAQRAAQAARNSTRSKEHLKASGSKGGGSTPVPGDVMELYRQLMPGASEADILAHYNRALKDMKG